MINIERILKEKKLTKTEVAERMSLTRESLYSILNGNPTLNNLKKLADVLGVPIQELFELPKQNKISCPKCGETLTIQFV